MPTDVPTAPRAPLPASILSQGPNLIVSIHAALDDEQLVRLQRDLLERVGRDRSRGILIDVAALDVLDSFAARTLADLAYMAQLRGARTVVVGIAPEVAMTLVRLGVRIPLTQTALDLEEGLVVAGGVTDPLERFRLDYAPLLLRHLAQRDESGLQAAYQLGRRAMQESVGLLDVVRVHNDLFLEVLTTVRDLDEVTDLTRGRVDAPHRPRRVLRGGPARLHGRTAWLPASVGRPMRDRWRSGCSISPPPPGDAAARNQWLALIDAFGEADHVAKELEHAAPHEHERNARRFAAAQETPARMSSCAGLVQVEVVDVDVEEQEAGPGCGELRSDRRGRIVGRVSWSWSRSCRASVTSSVVGARRMD